MRFINKQFLFLVTLLLCVKLTYSQDRKIDSLKNKLQEYSSKDTTRVNLLNAIIYEVYDVDMALAEQMIKEAEPLANQLNFTKGKADVVYYKAQMELIKGNHDAVLKYFEKAIDIYNSINYTVGISNTYNGLGILYYKQNNFDKALEYYQKALYINEKNNNLHGIGRSLNNIGNIYADQGKYNEAIKYYQKSKEAKEKNKETYGVASAYTNIGSIYGEQGNYPKALEYSLKALDIYKKHGNKLRSRILYSNIGALYKNTGDYDKALQYFREGLKLSKKTEDKYATAIYLSEIGRWYTEKSQLEKALQYFNEALTINTEIKSGIGVSRCLIDIASIELIQKKYSTAFKNYKKGLEINEKLNYHIGAFKSYLGIAIIYEKQQQYTKALEFALRGKQKADELKSLLAQRDFSKLLAKNYANLKNYKKAYENYQTFKVLSDKFYDKENIKKMAQLEYEYKYKNELESAGKRELSLTKKVLTTSQDLEKSQRNLLLGIIAFLVTILFLGFVIFFLKLRNEKSKTRNAVVEQKLLRSQMTPHFIFNSLSVLQGMILNKEEKKAITYLSKFSKLLRITLENSTDKIVLMSQELKAIKNYLALQNLENEEYKFTVSVDDSIDEELFKIPPMLIQPFVENAIEHAFTEQQENRMIDVSLSYSEEKLTCKIIDNGMGIDSLKKNENNNKKSLSTAITSERLKMLSKDFKMKGSITVEDRKKYNKKGTIVTLVIPYKKDN